MSVSNDLKTGLVFWDLPLGKPDPKLPYPLDGKDRRPRVIQKGPIAEECWYHGVRKICKHIGKNPPPELQEARRIEKIFSELRKQLVFFRLQEEFSLNAIPILEKIVPELINGGWKKEIVKANFAWLKTAFKLFSKDMIDAKKFKNKDRIVDAMDSLIQEFCDQSFYSDFKAFAKFKFVEMKTSQICKSFKELNVDSQEIAKIFEEILKLKWEDLTENDRLKLFKASLLSLFAKYTNLENSAWHPTQPIERLDEELNKYGAHLICGHFGWQYYKEAPFEAETIQGKTIWGWKSSAKRGDLECGHTIIIIGVNPAKQDVYFLDSDTTTDPEDPGTEKIYVMPYQELRERIHDQLGVMILNFQTPYAWHAPAKHSH